MPSLPSIAKQAPSTRARTAIRWAFEIRYGLRILLPGWREPYAVSVAVIGKPRDRQRPVRFVDPLGRCGARHSSFTNDQSKREVALLW